METDAMIIQFSFQVEKERIRANLERQEASLKKQGEITRAILEERERDAANRRAERESNKREFKEVKTEDAENDQKRTRYLNVAVFHCRNSLIIMVSQEICCISNV